MPLVVEHVDKQFPTRSGPLAVLQDVCLELEDAANLAIVGPSGSGKSTLLNIIGTLEAPTEGRVLLNGQDPAALSLRRLARFRNTQVGFVFQDHHLLPQCSAMENVLLPTVAQGRTRPESLARAMTLLERVGMLGRLDHRPAELSGGERQRGARARALINGPRLLLADEPTGNLDRTTADAVADLLLELHRIERMMLIVVTHRPRRAERMSHQIELDQGRLRKK